MDQTHTYDVTVQWTGNTGDGTASYTGYSRDHVIRSEDRPTIPGTSDPAFRGDPSRWSPEHLFLASLSQCHLLWYLHLAADHGVVVTDYSDRAVGLLTLDPWGSGRFTDVLLRPRVLVAEPAMVEPAIALHPQAAARCFIAASVRVPVRHAPEVHPVTDDVRSA